MGILTGGVGFFDSGVGGLTVLFQCLSALKNTPVYYYGDNANAPYGNKSKTEIAPFVYRAFDCFASLRVRAAVVACNTVTALFVDELRKRYSFPIVGVEPAVMVAAKTGGEVFVLATDATVNSTRMRDLCARAQKENPNAVLKAFPCAGLAGEIEKGGAFDRARLQRLLPNGNPTAVVLGCTHYSFLAKEIGNFYGCKALDGNRAVARRLFDILQNSERNCGKTPFFKPLMTTRLFVKRFIKKAGKKRGLFQSKKTSKNQKFRSLYPLYFLGSGRFYNRQIYERMFGFK